MVRTILPVCCGVLLLGGCTVGPNYIPPEIAVPSSYANAPGDLTTGQASVQKESIAEWWKEFRDPVLDGLVERALDSDIDMQIAESRISEARYRLIAAEAQSKPLITGVVATNATRISKNSGLSALASASGSGIGGSAGSGAGSTGSGIALPGRNFNTYSTGFDVSWEAGLFGGPKRAREAAQGEVDAAIWAKRDSQVRLTAEVARNYYLLRSTQAQLVEAEDLLTLRRNMQSLTYAKTIGGIAPESALFQPAALVARAEDQLAQLRGAEREQLAALALLLGLPVQDLTPELAARQAGVSGADTSAALNIPAGLPSELLFRRPDIRAAERNLASATARIGIAKANNFPHLSLTGVAELISTGLGNLVSSGSVQALANSQLNIPVLDFGRGRAETGVASEQATQARLAYQQSVLNALADVEQSLARVATERARNQSLQDDLHQASMTKAAAMANFTAGLSDYSPVVLAEEDVIAARLRLLDSDFALKQSEVRLFKALGGGWSASVTDVELQKPITLSDENNSSKYSPSDPTYSRPF